MLWEYTIFAIFVDAITEAPGNWSRIRKAAKGEYVYPQRGGDINIQVWRILSVTAFFWFQAPPSSTSGI